MKRIGFLFGLLVLGVVLMGARVYIPGGRTGEIHDYIFLVDDNTFTVNDAKAPLFGDKILANADSPESKQYAPPDFREILLSWSVTITEVLSTANEDCLIELTHENTTIVPCIVVGALAPTNALHGRGSGGSSNTEPLNSS